MGKKQHQKDKLYLTATEWSTLYGGKRPKHMTPDQGEFKRLPFDHCSLSLQPFENPYCDKEGHVFDLLALLPFLKKFHCNPISGEKMDIKSLIKLNFHKNADGKFHCPVMFKVFTANSHIVAVRNTGNVFCYEAIEELNIKGKNWKELLTDEPFTKTDIITIQDPTNLHKFNLTAFHHLKMNLKIQNEEYERAKTDPAARLKTVAPETKDILDELKNTEFTPMNEKAEKKTADVVNAAHYSTGAVAASFTSTSMPVETVHEAAIREEDSVRYERVSKKGYVRIKTNFGQINLELHCDLAPKACENFLLLCRRGYYNGTIFHRSIKHFMIQGGDPTGKGTGGDSAWGGSFSDEFKPQLSHTGRGILSMANSGPDSNKSQFFITFRSCKHLDGKHTIFGRVAGGMETLSTVEAIEVDNKDKPIEDIIFQEAQVFTDPFTEVDEILAKERAEERARLGEGEAQEVKKAKKAPAPKLKAFREGVGRYIDPKRKLTSNGIDPDSSAPKKKSTSYDFKNFSSW
ncbi:unnamed protein product [Allacma fusca]|uniref:RING-type E3 ubiquitin-protein ligase PPIL2 n=1 Tax=Allacma fusca TaxID=39272 RepID=A0A8J2MFM1_9HEXA|nr:unnamed protein product [Allacma fusca]